MHFNLHPPLPKERRLLIVFGTRPEALKCFPIARAALGATGLATEICVTAQHRDMLDQVIALTGLRVDYDLDIMQSGQTLFDVTSRVLTGVGEVLEKSKPDVVIVQGDTTTAMAAALAAFYKRIPVAHVEAGLRSHNIGSPFPEELNRRIVGDIAAWHFAPTQQARDNLVAEGKNPDMIFVTGNTVIDTLMHFSAEIDADRPMSEALAGRVPLPRSPQEADSRHRPSPREFRRRHRPHLYGAEGAGDAGRRADRLSGPPQPQRSRRG